MQFIGEDKNHEAIIKSIIVMSHDLGFKVIAEGVETGGQLKVLSRYGCDFVQGFYFNKPLSVEQIEKELTK